MQRGADGFAVDKALLQTLQVRQLLQKLWPWQRSHPRRAPARLLLLFVKKTIVQVSEVCSIWEGFASFCMLVPIKGRRTTGQGSQRPFSGHPVEADTGLNLQLLFTVLLCTPKLKAEDRARTG